MNKKSAYAVLAAVVLIGAVIFAACAANDSAESFFEKDSRIGVISREEGSGTRGAFAAAFGIFRINEKGRIIDEITQTAVITNNTSVMLNTVSDDRYAVGYTSLGTLSSSVKAVSISGVKPTVENVKNGSYPAVQQLSIVTMPERSPEMSDFISFIFSRDGQAVISQLGYTAVEAAHDRRIQNATGKIIISGSSSLCPIMESLIEAYGKTAPDVVIELQQSDSSTGIANVIEGVCDIGLTSRRLTEEEIGKGAQECAVALDAIAVIVNRSNPVDDMSASAVQSIFNGSITDWREFAEGREEKMQQ